MPGFYIQSLFERQLGKYRERQAKVSEELDEFVATAEKLAGKDVGDAFRKYVNDVRWYWRYHGERLPEIPAEGLPFLEEFLYLNRRESALVIKSRNSAFWCDDSLVEPHVLWRYHWYWDGIEAVVDEDGRVPLENVQMLLGALLNEKPRFPAVGDPGMDAEKVGGWERTLRHRRRNLVWLFGAALRLGEKPVCSMM